MTETVQHSTRRELAVATIPQQAAVPSLASLDAFSSHQTPSISN